MLPTIKRKTLEVPHGLAAIAAAVCLVLAFSSDFKQREAQLRAEAAPGNVPERVVAAPDEGILERASGHRPVRGRPGSRSEPRPSPTLLPWFPLRDNSP